MKQAVVSNKLFEGCDLSNVSAEQLMNSKKLYCYLVESAEIAKEENKPLDDVLDEGIFSAIVGGIAGATAGPAIMKAVCKVLGISESGALGNLMTSRLVLTSLASYLGYKN